MKRLAYVPAALALTLALAACGSSTTYTLGPTESCLQERGVKVGGPLDFVASTATGGAFRATLSDNWVTIAFGQNLNGGLELQDAWERFAYPNVKGGLPDVLRLYDNVVTLWHLHPQDSDLALVVGCLR